MVADGLHVAAAAAIEPPTDQSRRCLPPDVIEEVDYLTECEQRGVRVADLLETSKEVDARDGEFAGRKQCRLEVDH